MVWQMALLFNIIFGAIRGFLDKKLVGGINEVHEFTRAKIWGIALGILGVVLLVI